MKEEHKKLWLEFRESGLLWFVNRSLHLFGWAIYYNIDHEGQLLSVYVDKTKYRGFTEVTEEKGFEKLTNYIKANVEKWLEDL